MPLPAAQMRHGRHQAAGIGVGWRVENLLDAAFLHLVAGIHDEHALGHFRHHAQVMGDQNHRRAGLLL